MSYLSGKTRGSGVVRSARIWQLEQPPSRYISMSLPLLSQLEIFMAQMPSSGLAMVGIAGGTKVWPRRRRCSHQ